MTPEQSEKLDRMHRALLGEKANGTVVSKGLVDRVTSLEKWKWLIVASLFAGSATGNAIGRIWL